MLGHIYRLFLSAIFKICHKSLHNKNLCVLCVLGGEKYRLVIVLSKRPPITGNSKSISPLLSCYKQSFIPFLIQHGVLRRVFLLVGAKILILPRNFLSPVDKYQSPVYYKDPIGFSTPPKCSGNQKLIYPAKIPLAGRLDKSEDYSLYSCSLQFYKISG